MARHREYNREAVLDAAMQTFWHQGFEGTSMRDLVEACQLSSRSMYDGFGGKDEFFELTLDRYYDTVLTPVVEMLEFERGLSALDQFVEILATQSVEDGCLFVNTGIERANVPATAVVRVEKYRATMIRLFIEKLEQARSDHDFDGNAEVRAMQLSISLTGLVASLKCGASRADGAMALRSVLADIRRD